MTTPLILAYVGMAVMLTLSCTGSAIGVTMGGNTTIAALKKKPEIFGKSMLLCVLPSTQGLYGFAAFFLMLSSLGGMEDASQVLTMNQGLAMCAAGLALGFVGLWSAQPVWHSVSWACGQPSSRPASYATVSTKCPTATMSSPRP